MFLCVFTIQSYLFEVLLNLRFRGDCFSIDELFLMFSKVMPILYNKKVLT
jgi:hypothetical protein